jgi:Arc/MetJ-type ribon-helix-helix transcriptional regulator
MPKRAVRIQPELDQRLQKATKERGYRSPSTFIRAAIETELKSRGESDGIEEQTAASFDRLAKELRRALRGQQAIFALLDAFTKIFLACVPEPPADARAQSITIARERHMRLIKTAGQSLVNQSVMQDLLGDENE